MAVAQGYKIEAANMDILNNRTRGSGTGKIVIEANYIDIIPGNSTIKYRIHKNNPYITVLNISNNSVVATIG